MADFLALLLQSDDFMPHGHCYLWTPALLWTYVISDSLIGLAYFSIPVALIYFLRQRPDIAFHWVFVMFSIFIFACGITHILSIWTIWHPQYWLDAMMKAVTAVVAMATATLLWPLLPQVQKLTTTKQLQKVIDQLDSEIVERKILADQLHQRGQEIARQNLELEQASLTKSAFLANMSHELRTPLNAVIGFTGTLLMRLPGPLTHDQERQLNTIQTSSRHLLSLINDLLDLSRVESGKVALHIEPVNCQEVLREAGDTFLLLARQKALSFRLELSDTPLVALADRRALSQILINLIQNALKFTDKGEVVVRLAQTGQGTDARVEICVADTGIGITPEQQQRLFQPFVQLDASSTRRFDGAGLGLYLSQKLAALLDAKISCRSRAGAGSEFTLTLKTAPQ